MTVEVSRVEVAAVSGMTSAVEKEIEGDLGIEEASGTIGTGVVSGMTEEAEVLEMIGTEGASEIGVVVLGMIEIEGSEMIGIEVSETTGIEVSEMMTEAGWTTEIGGEGETMAQIEARGEEIQSLTENLLQKDVSSYQNSFYILMSSN